MPKKGRPFEYATDEERPVTVSLRIPRELYNRMEAYRRMHQQSITELLLDGLQLRLDTPADPRDLITSNDNNTVIPEVQEMIRAAVQAEVSKLRDSLKGYGKPTAPEVPRPPMHASPRNDDTVGQETPRKRGRKSTIRQPIIDLLQAHPEGLTALEIKVHLRIAKNIGDTLAGMVKNQVIDKVGSRTDVRYVPRPKGDLP